MATALHRLARLHCTSASSNAATIIVTSDQFRLLLAAIRKLLPRFEVCFLVHADSSMAAVGLFKGPLNNPSSITKVSGRKIAERTSEFEASASCL